MASREPIERYYMRILNEVATRATCPRRKVAAIIVDERNRILSTGYNGVPQGMPHCTDTPCPGVEDISGDSSRCYAVHAEANALLNCLDLTRASAIYCTTLPCFECSKLIANTPIRKVYYQQDYSDHRCFVVFGHRKIEIIQGPF
jgi:dCMP deaminase